jgi:2-phosphosulfolactate phosphatase
LFDQGASYVFAADSVEQAREAVRLFPDRLLCGERHARPLPGFDYGNSPVEFSQLDLTNRELILTTTNGSRAFYACPVEAIRLAGSFYNAQAVTAQALMVAHERAGNIAIVCAGESGYFAIEDASCAGYLVLELQRQYSNSSRSTALNLWGSAQAAIAIYREYGPSDVNNWHAAQSVIQAGLYEDPAFCVRLNVSGSVPVVVGREEGTGLLVMRRV